MAINSRTFKFTTTVRGRHVFNKAWEIVLNKKLYCFYEFWNDNNFLSIKTYSSDGVTVGHLPGEFSQPSFFLIVVPK